MTYLLQSAMKLSRKLYQDFKKKIYQVRVYLRDLKQKTSRHYNFTRIQKNMKRVIREYS